MNPHHLCRGQLSLQVDWPFQYRDRALKSLMASKQLFGHHLFASC
jgi:hypothetical protein